MNIGKRSSKFDDCPFHRAGLFLLVLTLGLFIGIDILDRGFKIDVSSNIPTSSIAISNLFIGMSGIDPLMLTYVFVLMIIVFKNRKTIMNLDNKYL
jgi:hypothetical protein